MNAPLTSPGVTIASPRDDARRATVQARPEGVLVEFWRRYGRERSARFGGRAIVAHLPFHATLDLVHEAFVVAPDDPRSFVLAARPGR